MNKTRKILFRSFAFLFALVLLLPSLAYSGRALSEDGLGSEYDMPTVSEMQSVTLPCKSAILIEQTTGQVLYEVNADEKLPIASVTKVMTLLLIMEAIDGGVMKLDDMVSVSENAASMGGSQVYLEVGEQISVHELLKAVFVSSANDGAVALAEHLCGSMEAFVCRMNERAAELGMTGAVFYNPTGLDDNETNLCSARDVALMSNALLSHEKIYDYTTIWIDSIRNGAFGLSNTNKLIRFYSGATGLKTGSTAKAGFCLSASAEKSDLKLCAVVLGAQNSADRFNAAKSLLDLGFANFAYFVPEPFDHTTLPVWGGEKSEVGAEANLTGLLLAKGEAAGLKSRIEMEEELVAPVEKGQVIGKIIFEKGSIVVKEVPITASESIKKLGFRDVFFLLLKKFCMAE